MTKKFAFVFPGQGSQSVGMLNDFSTDPALASLMAQADAALGEPLSGLIANGPAETLGLTVNTQPAMLLAGYVAYHAFINGVSKAGHQVRPVAMAGHSLGEYSALTAAGVFDLGQAVALVRLRAQAMQNAVPVGSGGMAAILGLNDDQVRQACQQAASAGVVEPVNFNAPAQVVIAGQTAAVELACECARALGAKRALPLAVSAPFHSSLLRPAGAALAQALAKLKLAAPTTTVINNVDVASVSTPQQIADALVRQAYNPVRWVEVVQRFAQLGVTTLIELGPGKVLAGLTKRIDPHLEAFAVYDNASLQDTLGKCFS
jgi:[acyl-carrier-protein] S-malonyltransferase